MSRPCRIGVQLPEVERHVAWPELLSMARAVEDAGFDSVWVGDHLLYDLPNGGTRGPWECWTSLAALAVATERVEIGPLVASTSFHAPAMLAKQAATVDAISDGRLILGLGAGWNAREYRGFGFPGAEDLGNMFQFTSEFEAEYCGPRDIEATRRLNPQLKSFDEWLVVNGSSIPVP